MSEVAPASNGAGEGNQITQAGISEPPEIKVSQTSMAPTVAEIVNELHERAHDSAVNAVELACEIGSFLIAQKEELPHGSFKDWIAANCDFSYSSAKAYMRASKQKDRGLPFSSLAQLYAPSDDGEPDVKDKDQAVRETMSPPTQDEADIMQLNSDLERLQLPMVDPVVFVQRHGTKFLTDKAAERLTWLVAMRDTMDSRNG